MTVRRTVEMAEEQLAQFEQWAHEKGYAIVEDPNSEIHQEVMQEMMERAENWKPGNAISKEQVLASFRTKGWDGKS